MVQEFVRSNESNPIINPPNPGSQARGLDNLAQVFGKIAGRTMEKSVDFASAASKSNLLQTHSMIQDVEANSKIEMFKSPAHAEDIANNAKTSIEKIKQNSKLNGEDRAQLNASANTMSRSLGLKAGETSAKLGMMQAKYASLSAFGDTSSTIIEKMFQDPEGADQFIEDQYEALKGQVASGVLTPTEANNLHKQLEIKVENAQELAKGMREGTLNASELSAFHASETQKIPMLNAGLPISHATAMISNHHMAQISVADAKSKYASGNNPSVMELTALGSKEVKGLLRYGRGSHRADGDINSGASWDLLQQRQTYLKSKNEKTMEEEGYYHRLNNFFTDIEQPSGYQAFVSATPEGARIYEGFANEDASINQSVDFGTPAQINQQKDLRRVDNLNKMISKVNALGIGANYPDNIRQPIPQQYLQPIVDGFNQGGDVTAMISSLGILSNENRAYAMNAFKDDPRKAGVVYTVGNLLKTGDTQFLNNFVKSQQNNALSGGDKAISAADKYEQLDTSDEGYSNSKLKQKILPYLSNISPWLRSQANGGQAEESQLDAAMRYVKFMGALNGDYKLTNVDSYLKDYQKNMDESYKVEQGSNFILDRNNVPLDTNEMGILASHSQNVVRKALLEYRSESQVNEIFANNPPRLVSSPGGRIMAVDNSGDFIRDKTGKPAYSELYNESVWRAAEMDKDSKFTKADYLDMPRSKYSRIEMPQLWRSGKVERPEVQGNIDLDQREKVWGVGAEYATVRTMTIEEDGKTILLPTIVNGKQVSEGEAVTQYHKTGEHLGVFNTQKQADKYDQAMHKRMNWMGDTGEQGKATQQEGKPVQKEEKPVQKEEKPVQKEEKPVQKEEKPVQEKVNPDSGTAVKDDVNALTNKFMKTKEFKDSGLSETELRNKIAESIKPGDTKKEIKSKFDEFVKSKEFKASGMGNITSNQYLRKIAEIESPNEGMKAVSSTGAIGKFQFLPSVWNDLVKTYGKEFGLTKEGINEESQQDKAIVLLTKRNAITMIRSLKREPEEFELYMAHNIGGGGASRLIKAAEKTPNAPVSKAMMGSEPSHNPLFFIKKDGGKVTAKEAVARYKKTYDNA